MPTRGRSPRLPTQRRKVPSNALSTPGRAGNGPDLVAMLELVHHGQTVEDLREDVVVAAPAGVSVLNSVKLQLPARRRKNESSRAVGLGSSKPGSIANSDSSRSLRPNCRRKSGVGEGGPVELGERRQQGGDAVLEEAELPGGEEARPQHRADPAVRRRAGRAGGSALRAAPASRRRPRQ